MHTPTTPRAPGSRSHTTTFKTLAPSAARDGPAGHSSRRLLESACPVPSRTSPTRSTYSTTRCIAFADNDHSTPSAHVEKCTVNRAQQRVTDGCYSPRPRSQFRLDETTSSVLAILGLLIVLPGLGYGAYRRWRARRMVRQPERDDEPGCRSLMSVLVAAAAAEASRQEQAQFEA